MSVDMKRDEIDTPALIVDANILRRNITDMCKSRKETPPAYQNT